MEMWWPRLPLWGTSAITSQNIMWNLYDISFSLKKYLNYNLLQLFKRTASRQHYLKPFWFPYLWVEVICELEFCNDFWTSTIVIRNHKLKFYFDFRKGFAHLKFDFTHIGLSWIFPGNVNDLSYRCSETKKVNRCHFRMFW